MNDLIALPFILIMLTGFLVIPWLTPISALAFLAFSIRSGDHRQTPASLLLSIYGLVSSIGIWFTEGMVTIDYIAENPQFFLLPPVVLLMLAIKEQRKLKKTRKRKLKYFSLTLSSLALYWITLAAVMSASV
ncbi:MAG: hypothetical protein ACR2PX_20750 [Endozoicomonas sp.]|uniref:hypothetical protein n=1 Tax=Endozoicomonas sp. TaxID=1892382 RepID=UPI003D9B9B78